VLGLDDSSWAGVEQTDGRRHQSGRKKNRERYLEQTAGEGKPLNESSRYQA